MDASDVVVERLIAWGIDTIFGLPGDGINGVMEALRKKQDKIRFIMYCMRSRPLLWPAPMRSSPNQAGCLPVDFGTGWDSSSEWAV